MKEEFLKIRPDAQVTTKKNSQGNNIIYVNGQTAFNLEDRYNASNWLTAMESAYQRSK